MNVPRCLASVALTALVCLAGCENKYKPVPVAASPGQTPLSTPPATDNTAKNRVDSSGVTKTPMDQSEAAADIKVTADIRRAIMDDKSMSVNAQNCKIVTDSRGMVTLRGVVNTQAEKDLIEVKAKQIAGASHVDNQLEVKPG